jgi:FkbM family methyltransferase
MSVRPWKGTVRRRAHSALAALRGTGVPASADDTPVQAPGVEPSGVPLDPEPVGVDPVELMSRRDVDDFGHIRRLMAFALEPDSCCIDVGAHRGAILAEMQRVAPVGRHIAFEPLPHLCTLLRETFPEVEVHQTALSNRSGRADFAYIHGPSEGWSGLLYRPLPTGEHAEVEHIEVRLEVLDDVLDPDYRPALIKIDVEGAEQQVIEGALGTLRRHRPIVIFEHGVGSADTYGTGPPDIHRLLCDEAGLRIFDLDGSGPYTLAEFERTYRACERVNFVARV